MTFIMLTHTKNYSTIIYIQKVHNILYYIIIFIFFFLCGNGDASGTACVLRRLFVLFLYQGA